MGSPDPRPFTPLDLPLVRRAITQRLPLDMASELARGGPGLEDALLASVPLADLGAPTIVLRNGDCGYVGQFRQRADKTIAHLTFLAPDPRQNQTREWVRLLEAVAYEAGRRGAHVISAEVAEDHPVYEAFRLAGFGVYSRQVILRRAPGAGPAGDAGLLRATYSGDAIAISTLCANTVPRLLQQAEPLPSPEGQGLIYERGGQVAGYLAVLEGKSGVVIKPYFHPEVYDQAAAVVLAALAHIPRAAHLPVYLYARAYQDWLRGVLERVEFTPWASQALMVKYTLVRVERMEPVTVPGLEPGRLPPTVVDGPLPLRKPVLWPRLHVRPDLLPPFKRNGR